MTSPSDSLLRYSRNVLVEEIGPAGQARLSASSVLVVGAGGLGSPALFYLAAAGIGRLGIVDGDRVEESNLNRQILHSPSSLGMRKTDSAAASLLAFRPDLRIDRHPVRLVPGNAIPLFSGYDAIVDGSDNFPTKYLCNDAAVAAGKPLVHAGVLRLGGQLLTVIPGAGPCLRCLLPDLPSLADSRSSSEVGILGAAAGILGAWQALEVVKLLAGAGTPLSGRLLAVDALSGGATTIPVPRAPSCPACGDSPTIVPPLSEDQYRQEGTRTE